MKNSEAYYEKLLEELLEVDSSTGNTSGIDRVSQLVARHLRKLGFETTRYKRRGLPLLYVLRSPQFDSKLPITILSGHVDTVFEKEYVQQKTTARWMFGSGANDMKGGLVAMLEGLDQYMQQHDNTNLIVTLTPDEESGSEMYHKELCKVYSSADYGLVLEGKGDAYELCHSRRGIAMWDLRAKGKEGHSGYYAQINPNAIDALAKGLLEVVSLANKKAGLTVNTGLIEGGSAVNVVAQSAVAKGDVRFISDKQYLQVLEQMEKIAKRNNLTLSCSKVFPAMESNSKSDKLMAHVRSAYMKNGQKVVFASRDSASDGNIMTSCGVGVVDGFGTYGKNIHSKNEKVLKKSIHTSAKIISDVLQEIYS